MSITLAQLATYDDVTDTYADAATQAAYRAGADVAHFARKHLDGDRDTPCLIEYPTGFSYCSGPQEKDFQIARDFLLAGWASPSLPGGEPT